MKRVLLVVSVFVGILLVACAGADGDPGSQGERGSVGAEGATGPVGPQGDAGAAGPVGAPAPPLSPHVVYSEPVAVGAMTSLAAHCPGTEVMLTGGCHLGGDVTLVSSFIVGRDGGGYDWQCVATRASGADAAPPAAPPLLWVFCLCAKQ